MSLPLEFLNAPGLQEKDPKAFFLAACVFHGNDNIQSTDLLCGTSTLLLLPL